MRKYRNKPTLIDGIVFDSKKEADFYCELKVQKMAGEVLSFERQVVFELQPKYKYGKSTIRAIKYIADFVVSYKDGSVEIVDVKGMKTQVYNLKKKMLLYKHPEYKFREV